MRLRPLIAAGALAAAAWPVVEPQLPVLRRVTAPVLPARSAPVRVLHVSDLHLLPRHTRRAAWVRGLARHKADLVVSTGDHVGSESAFALLADTLGALAAGGVPAVVVPGNNDYFTPIRPALLGYLRKDPPRRDRNPDIDWPAGLARLQAAGWTDLTHRRVVLEVAGRPVVLTGTDDGHLRRDRYDLVRGPVEGFGIGVTHTPQARLLRDFAADGHALVLAGHTHGGQLRVPGYGAVITNCDLPRPRARGLSRDPSGEAGGWLHVSAGLGSSPYLPVRVACRPEATLLTLVSGR